jgi:NTP pyrophosphatase (non-canonical NTP hydrolase)
VGEEMIDADDLIEEIQIWQEVNFNDTTTAVSVYLGLVEEVGEIMRAVVKRSQGIRGTGDEWTAEIKKECADVFIKLCDVARYEDFDLMAVICTRWETIQKRDWKKDPKEHGIDGS